MMDGNQVMSEMIKIYEAEEARPGQSFIRPRVCCMSAHTTTNIRESALRAGMDDYMIKPLSKDDIDLILEKYFSKAD